MRIQVLGAHNCESRETRLVSLLIDELLALDAGGWRNDVPGWQQMAVWWLGIALVAAPLLRRPGRPIDLGLEAFGGLERRDAPAHYVELVRRGGQLDDEEQADVFGEALPIGLRLSN